MGAVGSCERLHEACLSGRVAGEEECGRVYRLCLDDPDVFLVAWLCHNARDRRACLASVARELLKTLEAEGAARPAGQPR